MKKSKLNPVHPGEVLMEEFLTPMNLSQNRLALALGVPARRINEIALEKRGVSADTALRLAAYFGNSADFPPRNLRRGTLPNRRHLVRCISDPCTCSGVAMVSASSTRQLVGPPGSKGCPARTSPHIVDFRAGRRF